MNCRNLTKRKDRLRSLGKDHFEIISSKLLHCETKWYEPIILVKKIKELTK